ncbi:hypothetical protein ACPW96_03330 [Micromonospora sp. DT81.3]|uniref:hypothetical protein n=1 Tax=Micromonospora sp. DT81.3 TaxID=3416523 RepID=UPI003CE900A8
MSTGIAYTLALILLLGGMWLVGFAFSLPALQGLVFIGGILAISLALAVPVHLLTRAK